MKFLIILFIFLMNTIVCAQRIRSRSPNTYSFRYQSTAFKGSKLTITNQLRSFKESPDYQSIPKEIRRELNSMFSEVNEEVFPRKYKKKAIDFLKALDNYEAFILFYNTQLYEVIQKLRRDIDKIDFKLEKEFTHAKVALDRIKNETKPNDTADTASLEQEYHVSHIRLLCHRWMRKKFENYTSIQCVQKPDDLILEFKKNQASQIFTFFQEKNIQPVKGHLENEIIDFYYKKAILKIDTEGLDLRYINKI